MNSPDRSSRIRFAYQRDDVYPRETVNEIKEDLYVLCAPLCRGEAKVESNGQVLHDGAVRPGMLRFAAPGERVRTIVRSPAEAALLFFPGPQLRQMFDQQEYRHRHGRISYIDPLLQPSYQVERLTTTLLAAPEFDPKQRQLFIDGLAYSLLACLLGMHGRQSSAPKPHHDRGLSDSEFERCIEYADAMIAQRMELSAWANVLGMSGAEFGRRFQQKTRQPPYTWFMNWRIDRAKQLLQDRHLSVADIALQVGFYGQSHLTETFRKRVGITPGRWRAEHLGEKSCL